MFFRRIKACLLVFLFVFSLLVLVGCSNVSQENYNKLKLGMNLAEVTEILGSADECDSALGAQNCIWGDEQTHINIKFVTDKVVYFSSKGL